MLRGKKVRLVRFPYLGEQPSFSQTIFRGGSFTKELNERPTERSLGEQADNNFGPVPVEPRAAARGGETL